MIWSQIIVLWIALVALQGIAYASNIEDVGQKLNEETIIQKRSSELSNRLGSDEHEKCRGKLYCTVKPKGYPQEKFNNMVKNLGQMLPRMSLPELDERRGDPDEVDNCEVEISFEPLYQVRANPNAPWRNVIQSPETNYLQAVRLETCKQTNAACFEIFPKVPLYVTFCKQKTSTWSFMVEAEGDSSKTELLKVELPTCCSCHYKPI